MEYDWVVCLTVVCVSLTIISAECPGTNLSQCICNSTDGSIVKVECIDTGFNSTGFLSDLPSSTEELVLVGNNLPHLASLLTCDTAENSPYQALVKLNITHNNIRILDETTFQCMPSLKELYLDSNDWFVDNTTLLFSYIPQLEVLSLAGSISQNYNETVGHLTSLKWIFPQSLRFEHLRELNLESNGLWALRYNLFCRMPVLATLYLGHNYLAKPFLNYSCVPELVHLDMLNNSVHYLGPKVTRALDEVRGRTGDPWLHLENNPLQCDCLFNHTQTWMMMARASGFLANQTLVCRFPPDLQGRPVEALTPEDLKCKRTGTGSLRTSYILMGILFTIIGILFIIVMYLNRYKVKRICRDDILYPMRDTALGRRSSESHLYQSVAV